MAISCLKASILFWFGPVWLSFILHHEKSHNWQPISQWWRLPILMSDDIFTNKTKAFSKSILSTATSMTGMCRSQGGIPFDSVLWSHFVQPMNLSVDSCICILIIFRHKTYFIVILQRINGAISKCCPWIGTVSNHTNLIYNTEWSFVATCINV